MYFDKAAFLLITGVVLMIDESRGCYSNLNECSLKYASLSQSILTPSGANLTAYCVGLEQVRTCLNQDASCTPPPMALTLKTALDNATASCKSYLEATPLCQSKLSQCTNIAMNMTMQLIPNITAITNSTAGGSPDLSSLFSIICPVLNATKTCFQDTRTICPNINEIVPMSQYEQFGPMCSGGGGDVMECTNKIIACTNILTQVSNSTSGTNLQDMCSTYQQLLTCYNTTITQCPALATQVLPQMKQYSDIVKQTCGGGGQTGAVQCLQQYQTCSSQLQAAGSAMASGGQPDQQQLLQYCSSLQTAIQCFTSVSSSCSTMTAMFNNITSQYTTIIEQNCGSKALIPSSCQSKINTCMSPFTSACTNGSAGMADKIKCCRLGDEMIKCLTEAGCPDTVHLAIGSKLMVERMLNGRCDGYKEYCPGLETCLTNVTSFEELCPKVDNVFNCVSSKCSTNQTPANIKQMVKDICTGLKTHSTISNCLAFGQCSSMVVPPFPGSLPSIRSLVDINSPSYWCRFSKAISVCSDGIVSSNPCQLTGNYAADIATLKTTIDNTCRNTRSPCPGAAGCLASFPPGTTSMAQACSGMTQFATCINSALNTCGEASRVKASYSISKIAGEVNKFCSFMSKYPQLTNCSNAQTCLSIPVTGIADGLSQFTNQTFWAEFLASMITCTTKTGPSCQLTGTSFQELTSLYGELKGITGMTDGNTPTIAQECLAQKDVCIKSFSDTCLKQQSLTDQKQCCSSGSAMLKCLNDANCPDSLFTVGFSKGVFQSMTKTTCDQSMAYCPGIETCLNGMTGVEQLCTANLDTVFSCFETKCSASYNPDMNKIKNVIVEMCTGLKKHFKILSCDEFTKCTQSNVPMLPGGMVSLQSMASVNSPRHWCQLNKGISACLGKVAKSGSCSLDNSFSTDYSALKSTIDSTCVGTPEPCLEATACMSTFKDSPTSLVQICDRIPTFVTCVETATSTCGESSKIQAKFTLRDVSTRYKKFCSVLKKGLGACASATMCLQIPRTSSVAEGLNLFTNQTYMAGLLQTMIECTKSAMPSCDQPESTITEMDAIYVEVKALSDTTTSDRDKENTASSVVSSVMIMFMSIIIALY